MKKAQASRASDIEKKDRDLLSLRNLSADLGSYKDDVAGAMEELEQNRIVARIWEMDHTVWVGGPDEISNRLGWLQSVGLMLENLDRMNTFVDSVRSEGFTHALLLGMGGSSLAPEVFRKTFGVKSGYLELSVLDSTAPGAVLARAEQTDLRRTLVIVSTKSGGTVETLSLFKYFYNRVASEVGLDRVGDHFIAITDPGSKLEGMAEEQGFRATFLNDPNIGGRYSALSYFGLVPAGLIGVDLETILERALLAVRDCDTSIPLKDNPGAWLGAIMAELAHHGRDKLTLVPSPPLESFGDWIEQLIAESTGKAGMGILPVVGEPVGRPEVYASDRLFVHLRLEGEEESADELAALAQAGHPVVRIDLKDRYDLGSQFFLWEMATAVAGSRLGINPFDQPDVEAAKILAREMVSQYEQRGTLPEDESAALSPQALRDFLGRAQPGAYVVLQAYLPPSSQLDKALRALRTKIRDGTGLATAVGYGPRFLHSTGQLHKGDEGKGLFVQFTSDDDQDVPIPDGLGKHASSITFGVLKSAQALGDRRALEDRGRAVIRFHLGSDLVHDLEVLLEGLD